MWLENSTNLHFQYYTELFFLKFKFWFFFARQLRVTIEDYCISLNPNNFFLVVLGVVDMCHDLLKWRLKKVSRVRVHLTELHNSQHNQKMFWSFSNFYNKLLWLFWVVLRRKIKIWIRGKKVHFITKKGSLQAFLPWKRNFQ